MNIQVLGEGPKDAKIAFIGEAPGANEVRLRRPFVGISGNLFDKLLMQSGISRSQCYVTNVVKEQPRFNDITHFIDLKNRVPTRSPAYDEYEAYLYDELASLTSANIFVPMGAIALYALTRKNLITKRRGSILTCDAPDSRLAGRKVIPTIHPAATFNRQSDSQVGAASRLDPYIYTYMIAHDLQVIAGEAEFPEIILPMRNLILGPTFSECIAYLDKLIADHLPTAFDIETTRQEIVCISFSNDPLESISIPFMYAKGEYFSVEQEEAIWLKIAELLQDASIPKIAQNAIFDFEFLFTKLGIRIFPLEDTFTAHGILYPDFPKALDFMTSMLTREPYYKDEGKEDLEKKVRDDRTFWGYNAKDSAVTLEIYGPIIRQLDIMGNLPSYETRIKDIDPLLFAQTRGIKVNLEGLRAEASSVEPRIAALQEELKAACGFNLNPNSPKQVMNYFYKELGQDPYKHKGRPTGNDLAMQRLARKGFKQAKLISDIRTLRKLKGTYLDMKFDEDGHFRWSFNPVGAKTGRLSSRQTVRRTGGNSQNLDDGIKPFLLADPGTVFVELDLSQAENRIVAWIAPEPMMKQAFLDGIDVHKKTFALMFGLRVEDVSDVKGSCAIGDGTRSQRLWGKQFNHSLNYDLGFRQFSIRVGILERDGKQLVERYHEVYPNIRNHYHEGIKRQLSIDRTITDCYGKKRRFMSQWGDELFKKAYAHIPQSTVGTKIDQDGIHYVYYNQDIFHDVTFVNQVHDSIYLQMPLHLGWHKIAELIHLVCVKLETPVPYKDPFIIPAEVKIGISLGHKADLGRPTLYTNTVFASMLEESYDKLIAE